MTRPVAIPPSLLAPRPLPPNPRQRATRLLAALCCWLALLPLAGCGSGAASAGGIRVVATTGMIGDMARRIAGEHALVESLMGPGVDPHLYKPKESDIRRLARADLILYNGLQLEGKMGEIFATMSRERPTVAVGEAIPPEKLLRPASLHYPDPHVWFDVSLWALTLAPIEEALSRLDPGHAAEFAANAASLRRELEALDREVLERIGALPPAGRVLVTAHDAFGYFGRRYGMEVVGLQGVSTASEAGIADVQRVAAVIIERKVKAIFVESSVPRRNLEAVMAACRARAHEVVIGGELFSDAMGSRAPEDTYAGMVRHNVETIVEWLK